MQRGAGPFFIGTPGANVGTVSHQKLDDVKGLAVFVVTNRLKQRGPAGIITGVDINVYKILRNKKLVQV